MAIRLWLIVLLLTSQPAVAGQRVLLIRGLMDYLPGISPMRSLQARLTSEGYDVTMITHLTDGFYKNAYWDAVIGHSQGAIDALRDAPELARYNPQLAIVTIDPPQRIADGRSQIGAAPHRFGDESIWPGLARKIVGCLHKGVEAATKAPAADFLDIEAVRA